MSQADIACYASKHSGRGRVTVYEPKQGLMQHERSMMSLEEQWRIIKENHLLMIARGVASPRVPEACNFWLLSLRLWTSEGEVMEEHAFRAGLHEPELIRALDQRVFHEFFSKHAAAITAKGLGVALPLSVHGLASSSLVDELLSMLESGPMPGRLLHLVIPADALVREGHARIENLRRLRHAGCRIILSRVGHDLDVFEHITPHMADYLLLEPELVSNVHGNLMDEMMVTIIQGHAQRLGLKSIAGPTHQPMIMDTLSGIGIDLIYGDTISQAHPLDLMLNTSYFAIN